MARWFIVENGPISREIFTIALEQIDQTEVEMFTNGTEMLERLDTGDLPDLLFLECELPDMGGAEAIARVRELPATATLPIVMLSDITDLDRVDHAYRNGANVYFQKPGSITGTASLFAHIRDHWSRAILPRDASSPTTARLAG